jgi:hypothetical protein
MTDMVLVPREATGAMAAVGTEARWRSAVRDADSVREIHAAMIAAAPASGKVTEEQVEKMDLAYSIAFNEQMNHLVGTGMSSAEAIASASLAGLRAALASIGLECE